jgi:hypothetical protein
MTEKITAHELDHILDEDMGGSYLGSTITHDCFGEGTLIKLDKLSEGRVIYVVEWTTDCPTDDCDNVFTFRTMSGCHVGAFCYVVDDDGEYQCDLRNSYLTCGECTHIPDKVCRVVKGIGKSVGVNQ